MRLTFIFILSILPFLSFSQNKSSIDFVVGLDVSYRYHIYEGTEDLVDLLLMNRQGEQPKFGGRIGFSYNQKLGKSFFLRSGIRVSRMGYSGPVRDVLFVPDSLSPVPGVNPIEVQIIYDFFFLEVPLLLRKEFGKGKINPFVEAGISANFLSVWQVKTITELSTESERVRDFGPDFNTIHLAPLVAFGVNAQVWDKWSVFGQLTGRFHLTRLVEAPIQEYLYNGGLEVGIRRVLN